jgi:hypothetical protein
MPDDYSFRDENENACQTRLNERSNKQLFKKNRMAESEVYEVEYQTLIGEHGHYLAAGAWNWWFVVLGLSAALLGALTTGSALDGVTLIEGKQTMVTGGLALVLTLVSATIGFLDPKGQRDRHAETAKDYGQLRIDVRVSRCVPFEPSVGNTPEAQASTTDLCGLAHRLAAIRTKAPLLNNWVHWWAKKVLARNEHYIALRGSTKRTLPKPKFTKCSKSPFAKGDGAGLTG